MHTARLVYIRVALYKTGLRLSEEGNKKSANVIRFSFIPENETIRGGEARRWIEMKEREVERDVGIAGSVRSPPDSGKTGTFIRIRLIK